MPSLVTYQVAVTTTGSAGSATGTATSETIFGELIDVYLDFNGAPGTTDTTLAFAQQGGNILVVTDSGTDARIAPRQKCADNANAAITNSFDRFWINGQVTVSIAGCDALAPAVTAYLRVLRP